ncbi:hypothetical protein TNCV_1439621 [Trichonephila clavipes]|nr:hypothetical protein TNCV_1439621 [Trichonephila clavipes]
MRQLALRFLVVGCDGLFKDSSVETVLRLVTMKVTSILCTSPNTFSQTNQNGLLFQLLADLTTQLPPYQRFFPFQNLAATDVVFKGGVTICLPQRFLCKKIKYTRKSSAYLFYTPKRTVNVL